MIFSNQLPASISARGTAFESEEGKEENEDEGESARDWNDL